MLDIHTIKPKKITFKRKDSTMLLYLKEAERKANANGTLEDTMHQNNEAYEWVEGELYALVANDSEAHIQTHQYYYIIKVKGILDTYPCNQYVLNMKPQ
jgi:hypothetical protein